MLYTGLNSLRKGRTLRCVLDTPCPEGTGETFASNVEGEIALVPAGRTIMAQGEVRVTVRLECARCLAFHDTELQITVERECSLEQIDDPEAYSESGDDLPPIPILSGDEIDLSELVRQLVIISLPPRSLCRPDCRGLCPQCGADLNEGPCKCEAEEVDPRLAPLKALLEDR
ncbi:MAG: DUF177 domain-containing protein [Armatimonadota bacterium]